MVGSGGRESALVWKIGQSDMVGELYCAPGNAGTNNNVAIAAEDIDGLVAFAKDKKIGLTVVGPEAPLAAGIVDRFEAEGLVAFGPSMKSARLEASKAFMKDILVKAGVPTARYEVHDDRDKAVLALEKFGERVVVKADGLAAGKGVVVATSRAEAVEAIDSMLVQNTFGAAGSNIILEETLDGEEASILAFCDGNDVMMMPSSQDHKRIGENDTGPNTGGMGAYSPAPVVTEEMSAWIFDNVMRKTLETMRAEGAPYRGILYAGLMITEDGPKVLEFNCRFGDPECQPILMRLESDIVPILLACAKGELKGVASEWREEAAVCVVMASEGYPGSYEKGKVITGIESAEELASVKVFHAGTALGDNGVVTTGGRVLGVTATGATVADAIEKAYSGVAKIEWDGAYYRKDIGRKAIDR